MIREKKNGWAVEKIRVSGMESLYIPGKDIRNCFITPIQVKAVGF